MFSSFSLGVATNRDPWVYGFSSSAVEVNVKKLISNYTAQIEPFEAYIRERGVTRPTEQTVTAYLTTPRPHTGESDIKWSRDCEQISLAAHESTTYLTICAWVHTGRSRSNIYISTPVSTRCKAHKTLSSNPETQEHRILCRRFGFRRAVLRDST